MTVTHSASMRRRTLLLMMLGGCAGRTAAWSSADRLPERTFRVTPGTVTRWIARGDAAWEERADPERVAEAISAWSNAVRHQERSDPALLVKLTRAHYFLADGFLRDDRVAYLRTLDAGAGWGEKALSAAAPEFARAMAEGAKFRDSVNLLDAAAVPAMYWYASVLGRWAHEKGLAVSIGQHDTVRATMDRCLELAPTYYYGGPHRYFGVYYCIVPEFSGGDLEKAKIHFKRALQMAPHYAGTKVLWASELAVRTQERELFERLLEEVLAMSVDVIPELRPETAIEQARARELLARIDELF